MVEVAPERFDAWLERFRAANPDGPQHLTALDRFDHVQVAVVLVRRGGYAVGLARGDALVVHKVGTRYVQSRTAAGGWSQQRFARRRSNQADELVRAVRDHAHALLIGGPGMPTGLAVGGDRALVAEVLADPRLEAIQGLPRREFYDLGDPNRAVLDRALVRARAVRVTLTESAG